MEEDPPNECCALQGVMLDLPPEVLLRIFAYLDLKTLFQRVILVCKCFHSILSQEGIWKILFPLKWGDSVRLTSDLDYVDDWRRLYRTYDNLEYHWRSPSNKLLVRTLHGHYAPADSVHLMNRGQICVSGARDRTAVVWNISAFQNCNSETDIKDIECPRVETLGSHRGWVWTIGSDENIPNEVFTGCWDSKVRVWDLNEGCQLKDTFRYHPAAVLCILGKDGLIYTGCYDKKVRIFDQRVSNVVQEFTCHKRAVLSMEILGNLILSGSEDKTIGIYDQRMNKYLCNIHVDCQVLCLNLASELGLTYLRAGGNGGSLYTFDTRDSRFTLLNSDSLWQYYKVTSLCNFHGALMACSQSGRLHAYTSNRELQMLSKVNSFDVHTGDIADACSKYGLLATASSDNSIGLWKFENI